jgi:hypothetical protein
LRKSARPCSPPFGEAVGNLLDKQYDRIKSEIEDSMKARRIEIAALQQVVSELRGLINADSAKLVDIPSPLRRTNH